MRARELMTTPVVVVPPEASVKEVAERMVANRVSGVPVVDRFDHLVGIISESDLVSKLEYQEKGQGLLGLLDHLAHAVGEDRKLHARTAAELMTTLVVTAGPDASVRELIHLMTTRYVNRIPIVESGRVIGIVTRFVIVSKIIRRPKGGHQANVRFALGCLPYPGGLGFLPQQILSFQAGPWPARGTIRLTPNSSCCAAGSRKSDGHP